jgi:hypothetical protein
MLRFQDFLPSIGWAIEPSWSRGVWPLAARGVWNAGIGAFGDSYPDLVDAAWAIPC